MTKANQVASSTENTAQERQPIEQVGGPNYGRYVLFVLIIVYICNCVDRQILSILAEEIKLDLGIGDAEIGFLYGTAFAIFYAVFGIPLGRLADVWNRKNLISIGLSFWSAMTALSGFAQSFGHLAACRFGVGIGEASATPAAFSMISDYFSPKVRATVLAIYSSGIYLGSGIGLFLGGAIVQTWHLWYPDPALAPLGIKAWQAAFLAVGIPGILMAVWVWTLKEPIRGASEGLLTKQHPQPFRATASSFTSVLPVFSLFALHASGGVRAVATNLFAGGVVVALFYGLYVLMPTLLQWIALGLGVYITVTWIHYQKLSDPACYGMMFKSKAFVYATIGFPAISFVTYGFGFWSPPFMQRFHGESIADAGLYLGLGSAVGGFIGIVLGGIIADYFRAKTVNARLYVGLLIPLFAVPFALGFLYTDNIAMAYIYSFLFSIISPAWIGCAASTVNDLVMPRMRATASAYYLLMNTFVGLALGPFLIGQFSDLYFRDGMDSALALQSAMSWGLGAFALSTAALLLACRYLAADETNRLQRAAALGEPV
ncbi:MAG: MFS transporter [Proteobacteria bacterium]|nr:MFS transporter [Pseudomonadota bacterium]